jgi:hypothetical protein
MSPHGITAVTAKIRRRARQLSAAAQLVKTVARCTSSARYPARVVALRRYVRRKRRLTVLRPSLLFRA